MLTNTFSTSVVIIGGGIVGCATAYHLAKRGIQTVVLEKSTVAAEASGRNAGGVRAQCRDRRERKLAMMSLDLWHGLADELGMSVEYVRTGNIRLATTDERLARLQEEGEQELADGLFIELWNREQLRRRASYLGDDFVGAKYCPVDGTANPVRSTMAFAWAARQRGAVILTQTEAVEVLVGSGTVSGVIAQQTNGLLTIEAPAVLNAAGPWSAALSQPLHSEIPLRSIRLAIGATPPVPALFQEFLSSHDMGIAVRPLPNGQIYVSGFGDPTPTFSTEVSKQQLADLRAIDQMIPALAGVPIIQAWAGLLDVTPDEVPILGPAPGLEGYWLATGFSGHGFCLGPITGKLMAEWITEGEPSVDLRAFSPARFGDPKGAWEAKAGSSVIAGKLTR